MFDARLAPSLQRFYPRSPIDATDSAAPAPRLHLARGERGSLQVVFRSRENQERVRLSVESGDGVEVQIRRVGYVPFRHFNVETPQDDLDGVGHLPGLVPDPLFPGDEIEAGPYETNAFWLTVLAGDTAGAHPLRFTLSNGFDKVELTTEVAVHDVELPKNTLPISHFLHADALADRYGLEPWSEAFWQAYQPFLEDYARHGNNGMLVPLVTPPLDGIKRPTQLLGVRRNDDGFEFDWSQVLRWIRSATAQGIVTFEWSHLFTQWGAKYATRVYEGHGEGERMLWPDETDPGDPVFTEFLRALMPELKRVLEAEGVFENSLFHVSDEPEGEHRDNYRRASAIFREVAPWATVIDALSDVAFADEGLIDIPVPQVNAAPTFRDKGHPSWVYFCCVPRGRYLNRFMDTPLVKVRMTGWLLHKNEAGGFLHWGYNYWYKGGTRHLIDPYAVNDATNWPGWGPGDPFVVYPGDNGPIDSLRWEVFAESLQDLALLRAFDPERRLEGLDAITDYAEFPRDPAWIEARRAALLSPR